MSECVETKLAEMLPRLVVAGLLAGLSAACSSDTMRFGDNPFSNPFSSSQSADTMTTGSLGAAPTMQVQSAPLAAPGAAARPPQANVAAPQAPRALEAVGGSANGWTAQGGSSIYVGTGDTLATLSGRYNVPAAAILAANGLTNAGQVAPGQKLVIPVYNPGGGTVVASNAPIAAPMAPAAAPMHAPAAPPQRAPANMMTAAPTTQATPPDTLNAQASVMPAPRPAATAAQPATAPRQQVASLPPANTVAPIATAPAPVAEKAAEPADSGTGFRWPARGRVISGFGGNGGNEGINIAVPEGTPIKAAEGGVVAYSGSELKGYGNLVLIRHDNGWVTAYANNSALKVKRGERVTRGQVIAHSGQTGNVTSPQLHFELRKGAQPVDPMPHLAGL